MTETRAIFSIINLLHRHPAGLARTRIPTILHRTVTTNLLRRDSARLHKIIADLTDARIILVKKGARYTQDILRLNPRAPAKIRAAILTPHKEEAQ